MYDKPGFITSTTGKSAAYKKTGTVAANALSTDAVAMSSVSVGSASVGAVASCALSQHPPLVAFKKNLKDHLKDPLPNLIADALTHVQQALDLPLPQHCAPVAVAMSGGVDSSVVAAALAFLGYQVIGITLRLYNSTEPARPGACCAGQDIADAARVAQTMGFSHYVLDYEQRFREAVIEPFAASYARGETPIPCVLCNRTVKFSDLLQKATTLGCAALATGHYIQRTSRKKTHDAGDADVALLKAVDDTRDQSYFLYATSLDELRFLRFPLGGLPKTTTRALADFFQLATAKKAESQDICFVGNKHYTDVIAPLTQQVHTPGPLMHMNGQLLGRHKGIAHYTIGQRRRLGIAGGQPLYVVRIDAKENTVVVGPREALLCKLFHITDLRLNAAPQEMLRHPLDVRLRSAGEHIPARIQLDLQTRTAHVALRSPVDALSPGQACVFYTNERVWGGGVIACTF